MYLSAGLNDFESRGIRSVSPGFPLLGKPPLTTTLSLITKPFMSVYVPPATQIWIRSFFDNEAFALAAFSTAYCKPLTYCSYLSFFISELFLVFPFEDQNGLDCSDSSPYGIVVDLNPPLYLAFDVRISVPSSLTIATLASFVTSYTVLPAMALLQEEPSFFPAPFSVT